MDRFTVKDVIADLVRLGDVYNGKSSDEIPEDVVFYLLLNCGAIECCLKLVYEEMTEAQREELFQTHRGLDYSAIDKGFYDIAVGPLEGAKDCQDVMSITKGDLQMLIRALSYVEYKPHSISRLYIPYKIQRRGMS